MNSEHEAWPTTKCDRLVKTIGLKRDVDSDNHIPDPRTHLKSFSGALLKSSDQWWRLVNIMHEREVNRRNTLSEIMRT